MSVFFNLICPCFKAEKPLEELGFEKTIEKIKELNKKGYKLCCYVGRTLEEEVPARDGEIWVSLDQHKGTISLKNRLHLQVDFYSKEMEKLKGLFDEVAIDQNVTRGRYWWILLGVLLKKNLNSTLISPALPTGYSSKSFYGTVEEFKEQQNKANERSPNRIVVILHRNRENPNIDPSKYYDLQNINFEKEKEYDARRFLEEKENTLRKTEEVLKKFFTNVKLVKGKKFPYKNSYGYYREEEYFILKNPKESLYSETNKRFFKMGNV